MLIAGTSSKDNSGSSNSNLELEITVETTTGDPPTITNTVIDLDSDSNSRSDKWGSKGSSSDAVIFRWDSDKWGVDIDSMDITNVTLDISNDNSWRPANMFLIFYLADGTYALQSACANWPENNCFSTDSSDCSGNALKERTLFPPPTNCGNT